MPWLFPDPALAVGCTIKLGIVEEHEDVIGRDVDICYQQSLQLNSPVSIPSAPCLHASMKLILVFSAASQLHARSYSRYEALAPR